MTSLISPPKLVNSFGNPFGIAYRAGAQLPSVPNALTLGAVLTGSASPLQFDNDNAKAATAPHTQRVNAKPQAKVVPNNLNNLTVINGFPTAPSKSNQRLNVWA